MQDRANVSYATARKLRIIREKLGVDWETYAVDRKTGERKRIDRVYNEVVGDARKNLFCKLRPGTKLKLDEMVREHETKMAEFIEVLIEREYDRFQAAQEKLKQELPQLYGQS